MAQRHHGQRSAIQPRQEKKTVSPPHTLQWFSNHESAVFLLLGTAWVLLLYSPVFHAPFVYDDLAQIVQNPNLAPWSVFVQRFLERPVSFTTNLSQAGGSTYRPLFWLSIALDLRLWGIHPLGFHLTNLALHIANGFLDFRLLRKLNQSRYVAAGAILLWLSLPINSEVVAWISGRSYALCAGFLLLALLSALAYQQRPAKRPLVGFFIAALAALFSNELGVLLLPLTILISSPRALASPRDRIAGRGLYPLLVASLLADAAYLAAAKAVGAHAAGPIAITSNLAAEFWKYAAWITLPIHMSVERSTSVPVNHIGGSALLAWAAFLSLCAACVLLREKYPQTVAGLAWMILALLPFCGLVTIYQGMAERFTYIASAGLAFAIAALAARSERATRSVLFACIGAWLLWGSWRLHLRATDWSDPVALYQHSLDANPDSPSLNFNLAFSLRQNGDLQRAEAALRHAIALQPGYPHALTSLGELYIQTGDLDEAERQFARALTFSPTDSSAYTNLGVIFSQRGRPNDAARMFSKAIENKATDPTPYFNLAVLLQQSGHGYLALPLYKKVLELQPGDPDTLANIQKLQRK